MMDGSLDNMEHSKNPVKPLASPTQALPPELVRQRLSLQLEELLRHFRNDLAADPASMQPVGSKRRYLRRGSKTPSLLFKHHYQVKHQYRSKFVAITPMEVGMKEMNC